jgi:hypothetical protein
MMISDTSRRRLAMLAALAALVTGCSHRPAPPAASGGITVLSCRDAAGQQPADPQAQPVNGVESFALHGDTNTSDILPAWKSRDGHRYLIWKTFLAVAATARPYRIVTVTSPATAALFYASPAQWGAVSGTRTIGPPPRRIQLPVCGNQYTGYTGGILITRPACVTIVVSGPAGKADTVTVPILVSWCRPGGDQPDSSDASHIKRSRHAAHQMILGMGGRLELGGVMASSHAM